MADYAIGDIQGCYDPFMRLLERIQYDDRVDRLWFVGDLVNRGDQSLAVLRFIKELKVKPNITLGNHDLYLLEQFYIGNQFGASKKHTLQELLIAPDADELCDWLRQQSILIHEPELNVVMSHAGIPPCWTLEQAKQHASELESVLHGADFKIYFQHMYGNQPDRWSDSLSGYERWRLITNFFTRMRFFDQAGHLDLTYDRDLAGAPSHLVAWFNVPHRPLISADIIFGHWAALEGNCHVSGIYALDTGCLWGGPLTALRLQDRQYFSVF